ncbi:MAG: hypothetical protein NC115_03690 [Bacteroidales bacterium]|nr:hypothetical protein [Bacteroidales bacterium]
MAYKKRKTVKKRKILRGEIRFCMQVCFSFINCRQQKSQEIPVPDDTAAGSHDEGGIHIGS